MKRLAAATLTTVALLTLVLAPATPAGATGPLNISAPPPGMDVPANSTVEFIGTGEPLATLSWAHAPSSSSGTCPDIDAAGNWACDVLLPPVNQGDESINIEFTSVGADSVPTDADGNVGLDSTGTLCAGRFSVEFTELLSCAPAAEGGQDQPAALLDIGEWPTEGATFPVDGTGVAGASIDVWVNRSAGSDPAYCSTTVAGDGTWSCPALTVAPLTPGELSETFAVQVVQEVPGWLPRELFITAAQSQFAVTSWWPPVPDADGQLELSGSGTIGAQVLVGTVGELWCDTTADVAGLWTCELPANAAEVDVLIWELLPINYYGVPSSAVATVARTLSGNPPVPQPPLDGPAQLLCVENTTLVPTVPLPDDGEAGPAPQCACPAPSTTEDGLVPDVLVSAALTTIAAWEDPEALRERVAADMEIDGSSGWVAQMEHIIRIGALLGGEVPAPGENAWRDGLDPFDYQPDWWRLANGDESVCSTANLPTPPPTPIVFTG